MAAERIVRAERSLRGLALGDAFGDRFFLPADEAEQAVAGRRIPEPPWEWTDDTAMAASVFAVLSAHGRIVQDELARDLADRYDPSRGYGPSMHRLLRAVAAGEPWEEAARSQFGGEGSHGNGAAMSAQDTVPFALWCAAGHLDDEVEALWTAVAGGGDRDTTCAIAGGVVAARTGGAGVPPAWRAACEPLPEWAFAAGGDGVRGWAGPGPSGRR
ncbi:MULTISPECIES: ADP-ribosylglycohydrolase family protein [unclassified Nocardiopsis]|uniref:ADP-ribosylglycohydrolase family protein n=2 Tax=Nocardiopsidaceae TaxID=83676 RepID=UPI00387AEC24